MRLFAFAIITLAIANNALAQAPAETPAEPKRRDAPLYPALCMQGDRSAEEPDSVTVVYTINRDGLTEQIRVRESTDQCFEEAAISAVRGWVFEPAKAGRRAVTLEDQEVTFSFVLNEPTGARDFDARPIVRKPPRYPDHCQNRAKGLETVELQFDVNEKGETENIIVADTTNACFNRAAAKSVEEWKYRPKVVDGVATVRPNVLVVIHFQLAGYGPPAPDEVVRPAIRRKLLRIQKQLNRGDNVDETLLALEDLESEFADSFSPVELQAFHQLRAQVRLKIGDYRGALDDLRVVKRFPMQAETAESVDVLIAALEHEIANEAPKESERPVDEIPVEGSTNDESLPSK